MKTKTFIITLIIINKDAFLSKGASNEETASQDQQFHPCYTDSENISLLVNNSNISSLFPVDTFMVIMFAGALWQALTYCVHLNTELFSCAEVTCARCCCCGTLNTVEPLSVAAARSRVVSISAVIFFITNWCLKYKNKEKPKTGPRPSPRLNYDVKIGPKPGPRDVKKSGPVGPGPKCRALDSTAVTVLFMMVSGGRAEGFLLKSTIISTVLNVLSSRLLRLHQTASSLTSCL